MSFNKFINILNSLNYGFLVDSSLTYLKVKLHWINQTMDFRAWILEKLVGPRIQLLKEYIINPSLSFESPPPTTSFKVHSS